SDLDQYHGNARQRLYQAATFISTAGVTISRIAICFTILYFVQLLIQISLPIAHCVSSTVCRQHKEGGNKAYARLLLSSAQHGSMDARVKGLCGILIV